MSVLVVSFPSPFPFLAVSTSSSLSLSLSLSRGLTCRIRPLTFSQRLDDAPHTPPTSPLEPRYFVVLCAGNVCFRAFLVLSGNRSSSFCFFFFFFFFSFFCFSRRDTDQVTGHTHPHTHDGRGGGAPCYRPSVAALFSHGLVFSFLSFLCYVTSSAAISADF